MHSAFNSSSIFFDDQFHVDFLFYLVLVFTALRNSNNFCFWKFNKLATLTFIAYVNVWSQMVPTQRFSIFTRSLYLCDEFLTSVRQFKIANNPHHRHKKEKKLQGGLTERLVVTVRKHIHRTKNKVSHQAFTQ